MTLDHAQEAVGQIELMFGKEYFGPARQQLIRDLQREPAVAMIDAIKVMEREHSYLPSPVAVIRLVRQCFAAKTDQKQDECVEKRRREHANFKPDKQGFKVFQAMNRLFFSGTVTRRQILQKLFDAEEMRPGVGWQTTAVNLKRLYEQKGLDMDKPPSGGI